MEPFLDPAAGPISLSKLLDLLPLVEQGVQTEGRILKGIEAHGVDFPMTAANEQLITIAGGSAKLIELLRLKSPPLPPAPVQVEVEKKPEPAGTLIVRCQPADCQVTVQAGPPATAAGDGAARFSLPAGDARVEIRKTGYITQERPVVIKAGADTALAVTLEPDSGTQREFGAQLLKDMLQAAGGEAAGKDLAVISATGSLTIFDGTGTQTEWNLMVTLRPTQATLEARNSAGGLKLECKGEVCEGQSGGKILGKRLAKEQAQVLENNLRQFRAYHFAALLGRFSSSSIRASARTATIPGAGEQNLRLEGEGETFNLVLNEALLPSLLTFESKTGLGSGLTVAFADYESVGGSHYPKTTEIKLPDGKRGLQVRLSHLGQQATIK